MVLSSDFLNELKEKVSLFDLIAEDISMKKIGNIWRGSCPFSSRHGKEGDSSPSFTFYPAGSKGTYDNFYCYGCKVGDKKLSGYGSDIFEYVRLKFGISFIESVKKVCEFGGISFPNDKESEERLSLYNTVLSQNRIYFKQLQSNKTALDYIYGRDLDNKDIIKWRLGIVPDDSPLEHLRGRLAIPVFDMTGRPVGFGFRSLSGENPKYINSPNSLIYKKSELWYGLMYARQSIMELDEVILVEGYFDVMLLHKYGLENTIGCMGTALSNLKTLRRYTQNILIWLDPDSSGKEAMLRHIPVLQREGFSVKIVDTGGFYGDPAEIALELKEGLKEFVSKNSIFASQYLLSNSISRLRSDLLSCRMKFLPEIISILKNVKNQQELDCYTRWISKDLDMNIDSLMSYIVED